MRILRISFRLTQSYDINTLIYRLRALPLVKRLLSEKAYGNTDLKEVFGILVAIFRFFKVFLSKILYIAIMVLLPAYLLPGNTTEYFRHVLFCLTLIGMDANTMMFNPDKEKYYSIILMGMDARQYIRASYLWFLGKGLVALLPAVLIFGMIAGLPLWECLLFPVFVTAVKPIGAYLYMRGYEKKGRPSTENNWTVWVIILSGLAVCYGLPFLKIALPSTIFLLSVLCAIGMGIPAFLYLWNSRSYKLMYKKMLTPNTIILDAAATKMKAQQKVQSSNIDKSVVVSSNKKGYAYFNDLFIARHRKILSKSALIRAVIILVITGGMTAFILLSAETRDTFNNALLNMLPYFVFVMYLLNSGPRVTQAMFLNCDHSMLAYRFYRQPKAILELFRLRLITLTRINLIPGTFVAGALPFLLWISGGAKRPIDYLLLFVSIIAMVIFFSVHHLTVYYLLQPYNINMEAKSSMYSIVNFATYLFCYMFIKFRAPITIFACGATLFAIVYIAVALILVYRLAPTRFRLK